MQMNQKQKLIALAVALVAVVMLGGSHVATSSYAAVRKPHPTPPATIAAPPGPSANADLLKKIDDLEKRVAELEKGEQGEKPGAQTQIIYPPGNNQPPGEIIPPTLKQQIDSLTSSVKTLQSQVTALQAQVAADALKYESEITNVANALHSLQQQVAAGGAALQAGQAALQTLQQQFASHTHTLTSARTTFNDGSMALETVIHCGGFQQPCYAATNIGDVTTFVVTRPAQSTNPTVETTSGPIFK